MDFAKNIYKIQLKGGPTNTTYYTINLVTRALNV